MLERQYVSAETASALQDCARTSAWQPCTHAVLAGCWQGSLCCCYKERVAWGLHKVRFVVPKGA
jgi:hypothetical protein